MHNVFKGALPQVLIGLLRFVGWYEILYLERELFEGERQEQERGRKSGQVKKLTVLYVTVRRHSFEKSFFM